ncbi:hypothetical protein A1O7_05241 [Cladophialophora yegresii CBS 114405]|uniref:DNA endonuclease activator Ctp1 C-terminal domain-containing protein n=1 Tax=Cladophialophora yegresii CBS 114405 TaxID=1182544 RepID=W9VZI8_9EURO|nr:uncharacterized protein A1O7_05241 [Cladophialophora yegresii CBS 114405]EXJ61088.1 hypothetical protein A1O7_05241 [Cladophialophora yegresii CBS 114405]
MSSSAGSSLASTLVLALTQSEALQRQLDDANRLIDRLKRENEQLGQEVKELRQAQTQPQTPHPDLTIQLDQLFRKDAEKQAEIDSLRKRLAQPPHARTPNASSPAVPEDDQPLLHASRKRTRVSSPGDKTLREIDANSSPGSRPQQRRKSKGMSRDKATGAIPVIAEDGVDCNINDARRETMPPIDTSSSPNQRLQVLLAAPSVAAPVTKEIPRPRSTKKTPISHKGIENNESLRRRPLHGLNLSDFRVNPKYASGSDYPFREVIRDKEARKCLPGCNKAECCGASFKALAMTLPPDPKLSENDLLLEFLGPGSELKISGLTPLARTNLVHEARAKRLANAYGRMHRANFEPPSSPPAFWNVDIPSTQEQEAIRGPARAKEREKVEKRYQEALKGGRWLFADE